MGRASRIKPPAPEQAELGGDLAEIQRGLKRLKSETDQHSQTLPFPEWPEELRAAPNVAIRSALFGVVKRGRRGFVEDHVLPSTSDVVVTYSGVRLDQADLDIFLQIIHAARNTIPGGRIHINFYQLLKGIGRSTGRSDYNWLKTRLKQMTTSSTTITESNTGRSVTIGGLIRKFGQDPATGEGYIETNPDMRRLFDEYAYTLLNFADRLALRSDLQKWLHAYYQSHAKAYPIKVETVRKLCGSDSKTLFHFRADLKKALTELQSRGLIEAWHIEKDGDKVTVLRKPTPSQARYLTRREQPMLTGGADGAAASA